ncbi:MAG: PASTA domain-containing protein [Acidobacteriota bacterium]|nr:PASTA domain-containing protein [Acidobacteriota bacterium]
MGSRVLKYLAWLAYSGVVVVAFVVSGYFAFNLFVRSGVTAVPALAGLAGNAAAAAARDHGLRLRWREGEERYDEAVPTGHVILQAPTAGSLVKRGSTIEVVRSLGEELVEVPDLRGKALQAAQVTLAASGLVLGRTAGIYAAGGTPGTVVQQSPAADTRVGKNSSVEAYLCVEDPSETYLMPDLVYRRLSEVQRYFGALGLRIGSVKFETYEGIAGGVVLRQYPLPGHQLRKNDVISLVVTTLESRA